nr:ABC transporter B family member 28-like protein [Ipomoea batatas]
MLRGLLSSMDKLPMPKLLLFAITVVQKEKLRLLSCRKFQSSSTSWKECRRRNCYTAGVRLSPRTPVVSHVSLSRHHVAITGGTPSSSNFGVVASNNARQGSNLSFSFWPTVMVNSNSSGVGNSFVELDRRQSKVGDNEMEAFKTARHSVGRLRKVFKKTSSIGWTVATPTSLQLPPSNSALFFSLSPLPFFIFPFDSSDSSGTMSIFNSGGNGSPKNLVVAVVNGGIYTLFNSKSTEISSSSSSFFTPLPLPLPPSALYSKSGYLEIPSLQPPSVLNSTSYTTSSAVGTGDSVAVEVEEIGWNNNLGFNGWSLGSGDR